MQIPTLTTMLTTLAGQTPALLRMLMALSYVIGLFFFFSAVYKLKQYGDLRTMMSSSTDLRTPIMQLVMGAMFLFFPNTIQVAMQTVFNTASPLAYHGGGDQTHKEIISAVIKIMQVFGVVAVLRGLMMLSKAGQQGQPNMMGKGTMHLVAGVLAINIYGTWQVLENSLGFAIK